MIKKKLKNILPTPEQILSKKYLSFLESFIDNNPSLFIIDRHKVALGFALGISIGVIPLPIQVFLSILACYIMRANVPATIIASIIVNPFTYPIILSIVLAIGSIFSTLNLTTNSLAPFSLMLNDFSLWYFKSKDYIVNFGITFLFGTIFTMILFFFTSYFTVSQTWKILVMKEHKKRRFKRNIVRNNIINHLSELNDIDLQPDISKDLSINIINNYEPPDDQNVIFIK